MCRTLENSIEDLKYTGLVREFNNPADLLNIDHFDKPLIKLALSAASTFEHTLPKLSKLPINCPNKLENEGIIPSEVGGITRELEGKRPPFDDDSYKVWRQIYEKLRDRSENPTSINFLDHSLATTDNQANWETVLEKTGFEIRRTTNTGSYLEFTIPDGFNNAMIIYSRRVGDGGIGNVTINSSLPTSFPVYGNSNMAEFDPPSAPSRIKSANTLCFSRVQNDSDYDNALPAIACHEVYSGLDNIAGDKTIKITADDTNGMTIWGVAYWNGTFIWTINASKSGRSLIEQIPNMYPELVVPNVDIVISQSFGLNIISHGDSIDDMKDSMRRFYEKCLIEGINACFMSYQPFGKSYSTVDSWINSNGTNYQNQEMASGKPSEVEESYVNAARRYCMVNYYPYLPVYESFKKIILNSNNPDITTGETMGQLYQNDGQHLRQRGADVFVKVIIKSLGI